MSRHAGAAARGVPSVTTGPGKEKSTGLHSAKTVGLNRFQISLEEQIERGGSIYN